MTKYVSVADELVRRIELNEARITRIGRSMCIDKEIPDEFIKPQLDKARNIVALELLDYLLASGKRHIVNYIEETYYDPGIEVKTTNYCAFVWPAEDTLIVEKESE